MINALVFAALAAAVLFFLAWAVSPGLRAGIERPKYKFLADVENADRRRYDRTEAGDPE